jgi:methionyl-tRNA synthetase
MVEKFYVTTPIYYPNDVPHIGHAYTTIAADVVARWNKLRGKDVFFLTGTDDHGKKIAEAAEAVGKSPKDFTDDLVPEFKDAWKKLGIEYDRFIRTTDKDHEKVVQDVLQKCFDNGDIYLGEYEGLYCTGCEAYYTEKDLGEGCCPIHKKPIEKLKEKSYFFKLSKYQDKLLKLYKDNPEFLSPKHRRLEIVNRVKEGLRDLSISRTSFDWGIKLPFDKKHIVYVWFDALFNYYSGTRKKGKEDFWPADVHLVGKDIFWFHAVYWPAFLMSVGIEVPKKVFAHGWWTFDKEKISKSRGKVVNVDELIAIAGVDAARYFLFREATFGEDGDFSEAALVTRYNDELANKLGNLVSRVSALVERYGVEKSSGVLLKKLNLKRVEKLMDGYELDKALAEIFAFVDVCNEFVQTKKPWEFGDKKVLYELVVSLREIARLLSPFIPESAEKISEIFKGDKIKKAPVLFPKIEVDAKINKKEIPNKSMENVATIGFEDFAKLDLRVAKIVGVDAIEGADKLWKLSLDVGELGERTICAGIKEFYSAKELKGKMIVVVTNLAPRKLRGIESRGMLLAATSGDGKNVSLISPDKDVEPGSVVG